MAHKTSMNGIHVSTVNNDRMHAINKGKSNMKGNSSRNDDTSVCINKNKKESKRPSQEIYRPGMGLGTQKIKSSEDMPDGEEHQDCSKNYANNQPYITCDSLAKNIGDLQIDDLNNSKSGGGTKKLKNRRPDQPVYVPKPKIASLSVSPLPAEENTNISQNKAPTENVTEKQSCNSRDSNPNVSKKRNKGNRSREGESLEQVNTGVSPSQTEKKTKQEFPVNGQELLPRENLNENNVHNVNQLVQFNKRNARSEQSKKDPFVNGKATQNEDSQGNLSGNGKTGKAWKNKRDKRDFRGDCDKDQNKSKMESVDCEDWDSDYLVPASNLSNRTFSQEDITNNQSSPKSERLNSVPRCESPAKLRNSPKGRGKSKLVIDKQVTQSEINKMQLNQESLLTMEKVPTLIYERTQPLNGLTYENDFIKPFYNTDNENFVPRQSDSLGDVLNHKKPEVLLTKPLPKCPADFIKLQRSLDTRDLSEFQQNPPPRFQKQNIVKDRQTVAFMVEELKMEKVKQTEQLINTAGVLRIGVPWDSLVPKNDVAPVPMSWDYSKPQPLAYNSHPKQLYDPMSVEKTLTHPVAPAILQFTPNCVPQNNPIASHYSNPPVQAMPFLDQSFRPGPPCPNYMPYLGNNQPSPNITPQHLHQVPQNLIRPSFSDQLMIQSSIKKRVKPIVEKNLHDIGLLEREINGFLVKGLEKADAKSLGQCRWKLQLRYENIILADPRFCADRNVENALWKSAFHQVIEAFRRIKEHDESLEDDVNRAIINLVEEGTVFYESLLEKQQETFGINLAQFLDSDWSKRQSIPDSVKVIFISVQKIYICLGDLARYREQATNTTSYGKARSWYLKAQQIAPKNGRPYNQLAILAIYARRKLDAVYYYMRSLAASNPFLSARESLLALFDEARKKYELVEKKRNEEATVDKKSHSESKDDRIEIWIPPSRQQRNCPQSNLSKEESLKNLSNVELNKRFVLSFLHVHGKLFTKVGMELFTETTNQMLYEFRCLLQCTPLPMSSVRLLQLLAINMFAVANTSLKGPPMDSHCRPLLQEQALQVSLSMVAIVIERSTVLVQEHLLSDDYPDQLLNDDLMQLFPLIKVWTDWMSCQRSLWKPLPTLGDLRTGCKGDIWTLFANLLNELRNIKDNSIQLKALPQPDQGYEAVTLPEDLSLACFVPLLGAPQDTYYCSVPVTDKERARVLLRLLQIQFFGDYLTGIETPYLKFDVELQRYVSLVTTPSEENSISDPNFTSNSSDEEGTLEESFGELDDDIAPRVYSDDEPNEIDKLWLKQETLKKHKERHRRRQEHIQTVLRENGAKRPVQILISPSYLIPDTNCFIDNLNKLRIILASNLFHIYVPLVVINELDGLTKGERPQSAGGHRSQGSNERSRQVGQSAIEAVHFLEGRFAAREPKLRVITSKGSLLETIAFRSEEHTGNKGTNDDIILTCCLFYCKDKAEHFMPKDPSVPIQIQREVVLLTDDRNLRVKAISHNVPVQSIQEFVKWANLR